MAVIVCCISSVFYGQCKTVYGIETNSLQGANAEDIQEQAKVVISDPAKMKELFAIRKNGVTYVPLQELCDLTGAECSWVQDRKEVTVKMEQRTLIMRVGSPNSLLDNRVEAMGNPLILYENKAMVPLRFIGEFLEVKVLWDEPSKVASIVLDSLMQKKNAEEETTSEAITSKTEEQTQKDKKLLIKEDDPVPEVLTFEIAQERAKRFNSDYQNALIAAERAKISNDDLILPISVFVAQLEQQKQALKLNDKIKVMQVGLTAEMVENSTRNQMEDICLMLEKQKNLQGKIEFLVYKKKIHKLQYENGMLSLLDWKKTQNEYDATVQELAALEKEIEGAYIKLNTALHFPTDETEALEQADSFAPLAEINLERMIKDNLSSDPYVWMAQQNVNLSKFNVQTYVYNQMSESWELTNLNVTQSKTNAQFTEQNLEETIRNRCNQLLQIEENLKSMEIAMEQAKRNIHALWIQYDVGTITKVQLEEAQRNIPDLEYQMKELKQKHVQLKRLFEKPYLAPEYVTAGN